MADGNVFWLDVVAERLRRWPLWITVTVVALFLLFPFGIAYLQGSLPALMVGGAWRIILFAPVAIVYNVAIAPVFSSSDEKIAASIRPLSQLSDEEYNELVARACTRKLRSEWLAFGIGVAAQLALFGLQAAYQPLDLTMQLLFLLMFGTLGWIVYRAIASTRLSRWLSRQPLDVDIFDITPFEPIGRHSLQLAMVLVGGMILSLLFVFRWEGILTWENIVIYSILTVVVILVFFLSMWPTHSLLSRTKKRHVHNATQTIAGDYQALMALQEQKSSTTEVESRINAWAVLENRLKLTRTWPYNTEMMRALVLTVLTPIIVGISKVAGMLLISGRP